MSVSPVKTVTLAMLVLLIGLSASVQRTWATSNEHYPLGVEGIKAATLPPPGIYFRNYLLFYTANTLKDKNGNDLPVGADIDLLVNAARLIWITDFKIFGGNVGMDMLAPIYHMDTKINAPGVKYSDTGVGDLFFEPLTISWHGDQWDTSVGGAFFAPTGSFNTGDNVPLNRGFWTGMFTLGGTYYFDKEKTWSASILGRYEIHSEQRTTDITPGDDLHFEWGVGKTIFGGIDVGVAGYAHWQVTSDRGGSSNGDKDQVFAVGPEVMGMIKNTPLINRPMFISIRALWEFEAEDRLEGFKTILTLTIPF